MKRIIALVSALLIIFTMVTSCADTVTNSDKLSIVCTTFPQYDWVRQILGDNFDNCSVQILLDSGTDLHNFQPSADDIITIDQADVFIYVGGESDGWVEDVFTNNSGSAEIINLMKLLGEDLLELGHDHDHDHEHEEEHEHNEYCDHEHDEHVWLSLNNAERFCEAITDALCDVDADNADMYRTNCGKYTAELSSLAASYEQAVEGASFDTLVFADRYPFAYLCEDLDITSYAAFDGCSAETEASFETIVSLADKVDELGLTSVVTIDGSDNKIAETVISNTHTKDQDIITLDSLQSVRANDIEAGVTYLSLMEKNLDALTEALN